MGRLMVLQNAWEKSVSLKDHRDFVAAALDFISMLGTVTLPSPQSLVCAILISLSLRLIRLRVARCNLDRRFRSLQALLMTNSAELPVL
jgi:hypothetical protein